VLEVSDLVTTSLNFFKLASGRMRGNRRERGGLRSPSSFRTRADTRRKPS